MVRLNGVVRTWRPYDSKTLLSNASPLFHAAVFFPVFFSHYYPVAR